MNREEAKALLPVIEAFAEGKELERKDKDDNIGWEDLCGENPNFDDNGWEYRVKPEKHFKWVAIFPGRGLDDENLAQDHMQEALEDGVIAYVRVEFELGEGL